MGAGAELGKFQTRVNNMQQEIAKLRNSTKEAEERVRAKQTLAEVALRLQEAEQDVDKVATMSAPTDDQLPSIETVEHLEKQSKSTQTKLGATLKLVDVKLKTAQGFLKDELQGIQKRLTAAEKRLNLVLNSSKEQREQVLASGFVDEATKKVSSAEDALQKAQDAELPFLKGIEVVASEAVEAVELCEKSTEVTQKALADAKTYVNEKLVEAKRLAERPSQSCLAELNVLQKRLEVVSKKTTELKKDTAERRRKMQMQSSADRIAAVEATVQDLATTMGNFADDKLSSLSADDARRLTEEIAAKEQTAKRSVSGARKFLQERLTEMRGYPEAVRTTMMADLTKLQSRLTQCQVDLAKLSNQCSEREQRFVAQRLIEDANDSLEKLKADIDAASSVSKPILEGDKTEILQAMHVQVVVGAIQGYTLKGSISLDEAFKKVTTKKEASADEFAAFLDTLSELTGREDVALTKEQAAAVCKAFAGGKGKLTVAAFKAACLDTSVCVMPVAMMKELKEGAEEVTVVEVGEAVTTGETKTDAKGNTHGLCTLARDGSTKGWVLLKTADGGASFKPSPTGASHLESVVAYVAEISKRVSEAAEAVEQKAQEVSSVKTGPLAEVKSKLLQLRMKLSQEQTKIEQLKGKVAEARSEVTKLKRDEQQKVQEIKCKEFAAKTVKEATKAVEEAEAKAKAVIDSSQNGDGEKTLPQLEKIKASADEAVKSLEDAKAVIARIQNSYEGFKASSKQSLLEARVEITKLKTRAETSQRKLNTATESVRTQCTKLVKAAIDKARQSLRASARSSNSKGYDELFSQLAGGKDEMTEAEFGKFVSGLPKHGLSKEQISMMFHEFGPNGGMKKLGFAKLVQEYCNCAKSIMITSDYDIEKGTEVRKLESGECWEVLEGPREDAETQVSRVRGRALRDGATGWVTVKSGQSAPYLKPTEKPYMSCVSAATLQESFDASSAALRALAAGEVLELMEGPREDTPVPEVRLKCRASSDGKEGWMTVSSGSGENASQSSNFYVCKSLIAMTDVADLKTCKVQKKVVVGEVLQEITSERPDKDSDINRLKFKSLKDGKEGWVSVKGNQGTIYLEVSKSHYLVSKSTPLSSGASGSSSKVRDLAIGEAVEGLAKPIEEKPDSKLGLRARAAADGKIGWVFFSPKAGPPPVKPCVPKL
jgi:DNA repair exonuclease SbcCD ATPase subunit